jgi:uncharacterized protein YjbJ (UPF0337 family)
VAILLRLAFSLTIYFLVGLVVARATCLGHNPLVPRRSAMGETTDKIEGKVDSAIDKTQGAAEDVKDKAEGAAEDVKDKAEGAAEDVKDKAEGAAEDVKDKIDRK